MKIEPEKPLYYNPRPRIEPPAAPAPAPKPAAGSPHDRLAAATRKRDNARFEASQARRALAQAQVDLTAAKAALAKPNQISFQDNVRDYLAAQKLEKEAKARGEQWAIRATRKGKGSYLDTMASYARGSEDVNSAARARNRFGHSRGAYPSNRVGTSNFDPSRGNVPKAVKP